MVGIWGFICFTFGLISLCERIYCRIVVPVMVYDTIFTANRVLFCKKYHICHNDLCRLGKSKLIVCGLVYAGISRCLALPRELYYTNYIHIKRSINTSVMKPSTTSSISLMSCAIILFPPHSFSKAAWLYALHMTYISNA